MYTFDAVSQTRVAHASHVVGVCSSARVSNSRDSVFRFCRATALGGVSILVTTSFLNYIHTAALHRYSPCLVSPQRTPLASTTPLAKGTQALTKG